MCRRLFMVAIAAFLLSSAVGCRLCDRRPGWFTSNSRGSAPCNLTGRESTCFDPATGQPVPCPNDVPGTIVPRGANPYPPIYPGVTPRPDELHMPSPNDLIRPPATPFPAPGSDSMLPYPTLPGTPVKSGQK
jgi:hypothetical protein